MYFPFIRSIKLKRTNTNENPITRFTKSEYKLTSFHTHAIVSFFNNLAIIAESAEALTQHSSPAKQDRPSSAALHNFGSNGTFPRNGTPISTHILAAPPRLLSNTSLHATTSNNSGAFSLKTAITRSVTSSSSSPPFFNGFTYLKSESD
ncbi:hypothetical protein HanPSC8_Chr15g0651231 [Helianthus annuus]|nr:hypothetical protein HanPSC8_Chr15g0651231 [Helianthus annuus]